MNSNDNNDIVEDRPQMRSVALRSAGPSVMPYRSEPLAKATPVASKDLASPPAVKAAWKVGSLDPVPARYCMERTHVLVNNTSPQEVGNRIAECLRKESIKATVDEKHQALVHAETREGIQFSVRLWQSQDHQVLVEVQRFTGCCFFFHQAAGSVLRSAKDVAPSAVPQRRLSVPESVPRVEDDSACMDEGLDIAFHMLKQNCLEAQLMALESLAQLTKICPRGYAAECVLDGEHLPALLALIGVSGTGNESIAMEDEFASRMRRQALVILANCFVSLHDHGKLVKVLKSHDTLLSESLLSALLKEIASSHKRPHEACEAIRCLQALIEASADARRKALSLGVRSAITSAFDEGSCRHAQLENVSSKLELTLNQPFTR